MWGGALVPRGQRRKAGVLFYLSFTLSPHPATILQGCFLECRIVGLSFSSSIWLTLAHCLPRSWPQKRVLCSSYLISCASLCPTFLPSRSQDFLFNLGFYQLGLLCIWWILFVLFFSWAYSYIGNGSSWGFLKFSNLYFDILFLWNS